MERLIKLFKIIHIIAWAIIFIFLCWVFYDEVEINPSFIAGAITLTCMPVFYGHLYILKRFFKTRQFIKYTLSFLLIVFMGTILLTFVNGLFLDHELGAGASENINYGPYIALTVFFILLSAVIQAIQERFVDMWQKQELEKHSIRTELNYLKSQINPHFLFNTLNNIHSLAYSNSPSTPEAILRLSSMMRYMIYESNAGRVPLHQEVDYLRDFIDLQQLRYEGNAVVDFKIQGNINDYNVMPLLFIPLLENAYKHGPATLADGDIRMKLEVDDKEIVFQVRNPVGKKKNNPVGEEGGLGLSNVKKRLELGYSDRYVLDIKNNGDFFEVALKISH